MIEKGIIIIATGHANYGNMAYNLCLTIKAAENIHVAVIHDNLGISHLNEAHRSQFDFLIELPKEYRKGFGTKLHVDQLTPFAKTILLDADMLWLGRKPSELFATLAGHTFKAIVEGDNVHPNNKYYFWAEPGEIMKEYNIEILHQLRSEFIYFEKGGKVFKTARTLKPEKKLKTIRNFGEGIADELYFNIAVGIEKVNPVMGFNPAYWSRINGEVMPLLANLFRDYYLLSLGSNFVSSTTIKAHDTIMQVATNKLRLPFLFKLKSKKTWSEGRLKM